MKKIIIPALSTVMMVGCTQMATKPYEPEIKKEISYTFDAPLTKDQKSGIALSIEKSKAMNRKYKVNDCGQPDPAMAAPVAPQAQPFGGSAELAAFNSLLSAASSATAKRSAPSNSEDPFAAPAKKAEPKILERNFLAENMIAFDVELKSDINHIIRFDKTVYQLVDPKGNVYEPTDLPSTKNWLNSNKCATEEQKSEYLKYMPTTRADSVLVYPKGAFQGYLAFRPSDMNMPGEWTLRIFECPVATNDAGDVIARDHFFKKGIMKKWETTFKKETPKSEFVKLETKEVN